MKEVSGGNRTEKKKKSQVNEKRGDVEAKFRPDGMNGNGVAGGKAQHNGSGHAGDAGAYLIYIQNLTIYTVTSSHKSVPIGIDEQIKTLTSMSMLIKKQDVLKTMMANCTGEYESEQGGTSLISSLLLFLCGLAVVGAGLITLVSIKMKGF